MLTKTSKSKKKLSRSDLKLLNSMESECLRKLEYLTNPDDIAEVMARLKWVVKQRRRYGI